MKPMLAHKLEEKRNKLVFPAFVQPKLDGVRCTYHNRIFQSRSERIITGVPALLRSMQKYYGDDKLDGELFNASLKFEDINSCVSRTVNIKENPLIEYWAYDIPEEIPFKDRWKVFQATLDGVPPIRFKACPTFEVRGYDELLVYFKKFLEQGFEGLIYRHPDCLYEFDKRSNGLLKLKPWHTIEVKVIGFNEGKTGRQKGTLGALVCTFINEYKIVKVGSGLNLSLCHKIWATPQDYFNKIITIKYQEVTKYGIPRFPVFMRFRDE